MPLTEQDFKNIDDSFLKINLNDFNAITSFRVNIFDKYGSAGIEYADEKIAGSGKVGTPNNPPRPSK